MIGLRRKESTQRLPRKVPELVDHRYLMDAGHRAKRGTRFHRVQLSLEVRGAILLERDARSAALLGTVVNEPVFADVKIPASGTAMPVIRLT